MILESEEVFDPAKMRELYELGYAVARAPSPWFRSPPGLALGP